ncbi:MAG: lysophospholipase [Elusimicrobiota bacterium]|nr:MAG: lysophospholipase [Elusimicrobiota bacterium]
MWFPAQNGPARGTIVHFHGNGENMTSHYLFVYWLALERWNVFTFDYRGYGASGGEKSIAGSVADGAAAIKAARGRASGGRTGSSSSDRASAARSRWPRSTATEARGCEA